MSESLIIPEETITLRQRNTIVLAGVAIAWMLYPALSMMVLPWVRDPVARMYTSRLILWLVLPALYWYSNYVEGKPVLLWEGQRHPVFFYLLSVPMIFLLIYIASIITAIPRKFGFHDDESLLRYYRTMLNAHPVLAFITCFTAGVTEEFAFRGYIVPRLSLVFDKKWIPVLISAALFVAVHMSYHSLSEVIFTALFGIITGWYYQQFRSLSVLMFCHFIYDFTVVVMFK